MPDSVRKSGRQRKATQKVSTDPFAGLDLSDDEPVRVPSENDSDEDLFVAPAEADEPSEDEMLDGEDDIEYEDDGQVEEEFFDDDDIAMEELSTPRKGGGRIRIDKTGGRAVPMSSTLRASRGLSDPRTRGSKESIRLFFFGPAEEDQQPAMQNVYRWKAESVLPSREANNAGFGGYHRSFYEKEANRKREMEQDWKWYDDSGGNEAFRQYQQFTELDEAVGSAYLVEDKTPLSLVLGPYGNQHMFKLPPLGAMAIDEPFIAESENTNTPKRKPTKRSGWIVNIGERIQTLGWAPNQDGDIQYLALAAMTMETAVEPELPSAFVPQATPKKSAIQIWSFRRSADGYFDQTTPPKLCQVICSEFGDVRLLKWCRAPRPHKVLHEDAKDLGLLAGIWGDGHIRVLDITVPTPDLPTQYLHLDSVAFHTRPPDAVFSSLSWVSAHSMIGATSNGGMALFSLPSSLGTNPATPIVSSPLQSTYITTITTCYPSRPHIVLSTCLAGYLSMTDLTRVTTSSGINPSNTVLSPRSRIGRQTMTWHDWSQMLVTIDDNQTLQGLPLRRFYGYSGLGRVRAGVVTIAPSECHPFIAAGQVNGEVSTTNIMRKVSNSKETLVVGRWFQHTWRRTETPKLKLPGSNEQEGTSEGQAVEEAPTKADKGIARFVEGFKPELSMILKPTDSRNPTLFTTIHEAQTAITEVAWNPNLGCGGWIAAGTASGLLRVEDLGIP